ncbi:MAG: SH3 domain-containing protein [Deltaproteobacteria bacterium]|nr:MAG: SH3 domain-containing protein [Deltaproteobacteria bacterium]
MKKLEQSNYYDLLEVPYNASLLEIKKAYDIALSIYDDDSLATHSLFVKDEREEILENIESAFRTLIDDKKRASYDAILSETTRFSAETSPNERRSYQNIGPGRTNHPARVRASRARPGLPSRFPMTTNRNNVTKNVPVPQEKGRRDESRYHKNRLPGYFSIPVLAGAALSLVVVISFSLSSSLTFFHNVYSNNYIRDKADVSKIEKVSTNSNTYKQENTSIGNSKFPVKIVTIEATPIKSEMIKPEVWVNMASVANIRSQPVIESQVIAKIRRGREVNVIGSNGDWLQIKLPDGSIGWIYQSLVKKKSSATLTSMIR